MSGQQSWTKDYPSESRSQTFRWTQRAWDALGDVTYTLDGAKTHSYVSTTKSRSGMRGGALVPKPATLALTEVHCAGASCGYKYYDTVGRLRLAQSGAYLFIPDLPNADHGQFSVCYSKAYINLLHDTNSEATKILSTMAEAKETIEGSAKLCNTIYKAWNSHLSDVIRAVKTIRNPAKAAKVASDMWLTWSFGIKPVIADIDGIVSAARAQREGIRKYHAVGKHTEKRQTRAVTYPSAVPPAGFGGNVPLVRDEVLEVFTKVKLGGTLEPSSVPQMADRLGFKPENVLPAVWEIVPYSWLVDYFTNVGDLIEAYCFGSIPLQLPWIVTVYDSKRTWTSNLRPGVSDASYKYSAGESVSTARRFEWSRGSSSLGLPAFTFNSPSRTTQVLNMLSVAIQHSAGKAHAELNH